MPQPTTDHRRAIVERNVEAILDAVEMLVERRAQVSIAAVAAHAGVSRPTVYAHFATLEDLLERAVERAVRRATVAFDTAAPEVGAPIEAFDRLIAAAWRELDRNAALAQAVSEQLSPAARTHTHESAHARFGALLERGREQGTFRSDLPTHWLVTSCFALIHACGEDVRAGRLDAAGALDILTTTLHDVVIGPAG